MPVGNEEAAKGMLGLVASPAKTVYDREEASMAGALWRVGPVPPRLNRFNQVDPQNKKSD